MGYTSFTVELIEKHLDGVKSVIDLGAQNMYNQPVLPAPYASEWYKEKGIKYDAIDLSAENGSYPIDLSLPSREQGLDILQWAADLVVDAGTSEHVGFCGKHQIEAIHNCWVTKFNLCKAGGKIISENPKTGNWPGHGFNYYTEDFYRNLEVKSDLKILSLGEFPAMGNTTDGWNIYCVMEKTGEKFPTLAEFKKLGICQS
jgi:hypothetical protein